ncbi:MAG: hypothetical protein EBT63_01125 [Proteobacteria bacterium]|nr:hypothetical protein [Pseudomonadota bacterium]NCA27837.1 hypothetical protein [Pseudomonadota bacterium]
MSKIFFKKSIIFLIFFLILPSCSSKVQKYLPALADRDAKKELEDTSSEYRLGWQDGCETGISDGSNTFYKMFYRNNKVDGYLVSNSPDYRDAWDLAFWYCFRNTYIRQKSSMWSSIMKGFR